MDDASTRTHDPAGITFPDMLPMSAVVIAEIAQSVNVQTQLNFPV